MKKILLCGIAGLAVLFLAGCDNSNQVNQPPPPISQPPPIDFQAKCSEQAQKTLDDFKISMPGASSKFGQQNHYNLKLNKCFVIVSYNPPLAGGNVNRDYEPNEIDYLYDAYENINLADCTFYWNRTSANFSNPDTYTMCLIGNNKSTYQEFIDFVNQRMESNFK